MQNCGGTVEPTTRQVPLQIGVRAAVVLTLLAVSPCAKMSNLMKGCSSSVCAWNALVFLIFGREFPGTILAPTSFIKKWKMIGNKRR